MLLAVIRKHLLISFATFLLVSFSVVVAVADTAQIKINYVIGDFGIEEIASEEAATFSKFDLGKNLGFQDQPVWFRIDVESDHVADDQYLIITPVHIDNIQVFANRVDRYRQILNAGDRDTSPISMIPEGYSVKITSHQLDTPIYVRIASQNVVYPFFKLVRASEARNMATTSVFWFSLSFAITLLYFAWAASAAVSSPQLLLFTFILRLALFVCTLSVHSGMWRFLVNGEVLPPQDLLHNASGLAYITVAQLFDFALLRTLYCRKAIKGFLGLIILSTLAKLSLFALGEVSLALAVNNTSALLTLVLGAIMILLPRQQELDTSKIYLSRPAVGAYFALQALPLIILLFLTYFDNSNYLRIFELVFINYALVPGGFVAYAMLKYQQRLFRQKTELELHAQHLTELSMLEGSKRSEMKRLLETLAHEIKTPLATLQMAKAVGRIDQKLLQKTTDSISTALSQISRAEHIERGALALEAKEVDLCALIHKVVMALDSSASVDCIDLKVNADLNALYIVLNNLIGNAEKYKTPKTQVMISVEKLDNRIEVFITNFLSRPVREPNRLFEKYYRDASSVKQPGTGLGLYLAKSLAEAFGANLTVKKSNNQFVVSLSLASAM